MFPKHGLASETRVDEARAFPAKIESVETLYLFVFLFVFFVVLAQLRTRDRFSFPLKLL